MRVRVLGSGRAYAARPGDDLLEVLQSNDEPIATACGGVASCGLCRVTIVSGGEALVALRPQELVHLGDGVDAAGIGTATRERLACQARLRPEGTTVTEIVVSLGTALDPQNGLDGKGGA